MIFCKIVKIQFFGYFWRLVFFTKKQKTERIVSIQQVRVAQLRFWGK